MQLVLNALIAGSFAALLASGLSLVYGVLGIFNFALGQIALLTGYIAWWCMNSFGVPFYWSACIALVFTTFFSLLVFEIFIAPYYRRHAFLPLVTTIALSMLLDGAIILLFGEQAKSLNVGISGVITLGSGVISLEQITLIITTIVILCTVFWILFLTTIGRKIRATVQHPEAAESLGIPSSLLHRVVFIVSALLAGLAGLYQGIDQNLSPNFGFAITIKAYAALIAGGKSSLKGTILCAYSIALLEQLSVGIPWLGGSYIPAGYQNTVALFVIILFLLWRPQGLFGSIIRRA